MIGRRRRRATTRERLNAQRRVTEEEIATEILAAVERGDMEWHPEDLELPVRDRRVKFTEAYVERRARETREGTGDGDDGH